MSRQSHVVSYSLPIRSYTCTLWCARLGIIFSFIRIIADSRRTHAPSGALARASLPPISAVSSLVAILFVLMWILVLTVKVYSRTHTTLCTCLRLILAFDP
ncbi:hypothetical protein BV22DRAFT_1135242 [Leucogyrophana mollusca]|uniref:Uncharacterized protein n=1 Tax=Leucogyrophana mollusca TaxID=85980 RepID=A0ACB8AVW9_9AGAM|nr:hypothetical protein BV22DRAFT_1135242 [Leucogyrophana mollusca]